MNTNKELCIRCNKPNRFAKLLAPNKKGMSSLYKSIPDTYRSFLDQKEIRSKIEVKYDTVKA